MELQTISNSKLSECIQDTINCNEDDPVNHPNHYTQGDIECIDAIKASMTFEAFCGYLKGNVQKYIWRYENKGKLIEDLEKAQWYISKLINEYKKKVGSDV